jgi:hypothetical protein
MEGSSNKHLEHRAAVSKAIAMSNISSKWEPKSARFRQNYWVDEGQIGILLKTPRRMGKGRHCTGLSLSHYPQHGSLYNADACWCEILQPRKPCWSIENRIPQSLPEVILSAYDISSDQDQVYQVFISIFSAWSLSSFSEEIAAFSSLLWAPLQRHGTALGLNGGVVRLHLHLA